MSPEPARTFYRIRCDKQVSPFIFFGADDAETIANLLEADGRNPTAYLCKRTAYETGSEQPRERERRLSKEKLAAYARCERERGVRRAFDAERATFAAEFGESQST